MYHSAVLVLKALIDGHSIKIGDDIWCYYEGKIGIQHVMEHYKDGKLISKEDVVCRVEYPLDVFIKDCEKIPSNDLLLMTAENVLNKLKEGAVKKNRE